jgi:DNA replicative helicase MCM subunit Mcm2 (Cdc46/Mcm family)
VKRKKRRRRDKPLAAEASYVCDACGEEIVVPVDSSAGESQEYVEDCPVCCRPNLIHVDIDPDGSVRVWGEGE